MKRPMFTLITVFILHHCFSLAFAAGPFLPQTGQTTCYDELGNGIDCDGTGQDGDLQTGVTWPDPRFYDNNNGTITDNLTGLIWLKDANCFGKMYWTTAISSANALANGQCGLTDGSTAGEWRLPNVLELFSLDRHPWVLNVCGDFYWSSSSSDGNDAWIVGGGRKINHRKDYNYCVWPVRGGQ